MDSGGTRRRDWHKPGLGFTFRGRQARSQRLHILETATGLGFHLGISGSRMNATLITDLETVLKKLTELYHASDNTASEYEISVAQIHIQRAIEWEKNRP